MLRQEGCVKLEGMEPAAVIQGDRAAESRRGDIKRQDRRKAGSANTGR